MTFIRILSVREYARIQGFPDSYQFYSSTDSTVEKYKQIGNAVSPPMGRALGLAIREVMGVRVSGRTAGRN